MATLNNTTKGTSMMIDALPERTEIDPVFKEVMTFNFGQLSLPIETQVEVSRLPRVLNEVKDQTRSFCFCKPKIGKKSEQKRLSTIFVSIINWSTKGKKIG